jgi:hypothetical protein
VQKYRDRSGTTNSNNNNYIHYQSINMPKTKFYITNNPINQLSLQIYLNQNL